MQERKEQAPSTDTHCSQSSCRRRRARFLVPAASPHSSAMLCCLSPGAPLSNSSLLLSVLPISRALTCTHARQAACCSLDVLYTAGFISATCSLPLTD
eukprot:4979689-Pleurochrysis_carterae.AAC.6